MARHKFDKVLGEFKRGELFSSDGEKVTDRKQALAIAFSEEKESRAEKTKQARRSIDRAIRG